MRDLQPAEGRFLARTEEEALATLGASLRRADVEDLALEQLAASEASADVELTPEIPVVAQPIAQEAAADRLDAAARAATAEAQRSVRNAQRNTVQVPDPLAPGAPRARTRARRPAPPSRRRAAGRGWPSALTASSPSWWPSTPQPSSASTAPPPTEAARLDAAAARARQEHDQALDRVAQLAARRGELGALRLRERRALDEQIAYPARHSSAA